jgi:hypothetical protein
VSYNYFVKNIPKISLGDIYGNNLTETGPVNYAAVVSIGNQTTNGGPIADGTYGDFGAGLYGNSTLCTILSQIPIGGALKPSWIVDVAGRNGGNGTLTIGLTANAIATAKNTPGTIVMPMAFSGTSITTANGTIPGYNKAQVSGTTLSISKNCTIRILIVPSVFDTGGGPNAVAYAPRFQGLGVGNMTLSYRGKTILSYNGTTPFGGNVVVDTNTQGGVRVNPGGAAIYQNYKVVFSLNNTGTGQVILVPSTIPAYVSPFQISLNPNAAAWCSDFIDRQEAINQNATPPMSQWTTALIPQYGPLNPQLYSTSSLSGNALAISQALASFDRGNAFFNVPMNQPRPRNPNALRNTQSSVIPHSYRKCDQPIPNSHSLLSSGGLPRCRGRRPLLQITEHGQGPTQCLQQPGKSHLPTPTWRPPLHRSLERNQACRDVARGEWNQPRRHAILRSLGHQQPRQHTSHFRHPEPQRNHRLPLRRKNRRPLATSRCSNFAIRTRKLVLQQFHPRRAIAAHCCFHAAGGSNRRNLGNDEFHLRADH